MINLNHLSYRYKGGIEALSDVTAEIGPGIHLLLGENGAGKTTLLHIIAGLLFPTMGECQIDGLATRKREPSTLQDIFFLGDSMIFSGYSINDLIGVHAVFYPRFDAAMLRQNLAEFGMTGNEPLNKLSLGTRRKAQLAYALALRTPYLLMDEPANGLDITSKYGLQNMLARCIDPEQTVIISTHTVWDLQNLFDGVLVLSHAHLLLCQPTEVVLERIAFVDDVVPPVGALYVAQQLGRFQGIVQNTTGQLSELNYTLLYMALQSPQRDALLRIINNQPL